METPLKRLLLAIDMIEPVISHNTTLLDKAYDEALIHSQDICLSNNKLLEQVRDGVVERLSDEECIDRVLIALTKELNVHTRNLKEKI
jgi:hypothetical protein